MPIFTHDRIDVRKGAGVLGVLNMPGVLWGGNALQSITIGRHTPRDPQQAVGHLGIVDYTSGQITSDVTLDTVIVEACVKADLVGYVNSIMKYAAQAIIVGTESYVMTSAGVNFPAGAPAQLNCGYMTTTMASHLGIQAAITTPESGEESSYAIVMGDDGSGITLSVDWNGTVSPVDSVVPWIDQNGALQTFNDNGVSAGVQNVNVSANINHQNVLDMRTAQPIAFVTTYPVQITCDMEVHVPPVDSSLGQNYPGGTSYNPDTYQNLMSKLENLRVMSRAYTAKHTTTQPIISTSTNDCYMAVIGLTKVDDNESVAVGRMLSYTFNYIAADFVIPVGDPNVSTSI